MAASRRRKAASAGAAAQPAVRKPGRAAPRRGLWVAALVGALWALVWLAPASWLAGAVWQTTGQRVLLAQAQGTWHDGTALFTLSGGPDSRGATVLPGQMHWRVSLADLWRGNVRVQLDWPAVSPQPLVAQIGLGWAKWQVNLRPASGSVWAGAVPLALLDGLGTPWNTLALRGTGEVRLEGVRIASSAGRMRIDGTIKATLPDVSSRLSTLSPLGSYTVDIFGRGADAQVSVTSPSGPLLLQGRGSWNGQALRFSGTARAAPGSEAALSTLLPLLGQRDGDQIRIAL